MKLSKLLSLLLVLSMVLGFTAACGNSKDSGSGSKDADTEQKDGSAAKEEGLMSDGSLLIATHKIAVDGKLDDWKSVKTIAIDKNTDGADLTCKHDVSLAWNGSDKLYVKGTFRQPAGTNIADQKADSAEFYKDDIFEVFLIDKVPADDTENRTNTLHYAVNSKQLFTATDAFGYTLASDATVKFVPLKNDEWSFEMEIPLNDNMKKAAADGKEIYVKVGTENNSAQEFALMGTSGGFWDVSNYLTAKFAK